MDHGLICDITQKGTSTGPEGEENVRPAIVLRVICNGGMKDVMNYLRVIRP